jgi:PAS domain S-box-containing protein
LSSVDPSALLSSIVESSDDAIISTSVDGTVTLWNRAAARLFGYEPSELIGQSILCIVPPGLQDEERLVVDRALNGESVGHYQTTRRRKDGHLVPVSMAVSSICDPDGRIVGIARIARDLTDQQRFERDIFRFAAIVESSDDAIVSKDLNGIIQTWNRAAERMFGFTEQEAVGRSITIIVPEERLDEETHVLSNIRAGRAVEHFETVRRHKDGHRLPISLSVSPIRDHGGRVIGASKIARDITEQKRLTEQLSRASRLKDEFLATLSHELRTPLNAILGYARMLRTAALDADRRDRALEIVERNAKTLAQLVADVLDVSRIVTGKLRLDVRTLDVVPIIDAAMDTVRPTFEAKGVTLARAFSESTGQVAADPDRLQQVVWNLLTNAVKFTPHGGRVEVRLEKVRSHLEISVRDTGVGIAREFVPYVFERFTQADGGVTRQFGGLGLGLALARHFVELHGGTIDAESEGQGRGSTFRVCLPIAGVNRPAAGGQLAWADSVGDLSNRLRGLTVLAVDDDPDSLLLVQDALQSAGAAVMTAQSGSSALSALDHQCPDVIVADIGMPQMDGYEFIRNVRRRAATRGGAVPAAALTAYARAEDRMEALTAGFQLHLAKPIDPRDLVAAVAALNARSER